MTTIACDGKSMAGDGLVIDHYDTIVASDRPKVFRLKDGRIVGAAGNSFDAAAWREWLEGGKNGDCPVESEKFVGLILNLDGSVMWVDWKGRELETPAPTAIGSGQDYALGAMAVGASTEEAVSASISRDPYSGGTITAHYLDTIDLRVAA